MPYSTDDLTDDGLTSMVYSNPVFPTSLNKKCALDLVDLLLDNGIIPTRLIHSCSGLVAYPGSDGIRIVASVYGEGLDEDTDEQVHFEALWKLVNVSSSMGQLELESLEIIDD